MVARYPTGVPVTAASGNAIATSVNVTLTSGQASPVVMIRTNIQNTSTGLGRNSGLIHCVTVTAYQRMPMPAMKAIWMILLKRSVRAEAAQAMLVGSPALE